MRLERRTALKEVKKREKQVVDTLQLTSEICTQRHHEGLFRKMRETLPAFFGFEAVGVLMYNFEQNQFFSDPDTSKDEKKADETIDSDDDLEEEQDKGDTLNSTDFKKSKQKKKEEPVNYFKEDLNLTEEQKMQRIRDTHAKKFMNFPTNSGISGSVFKSKDIYYSNNASKETKFQEEIDN